MRKLRRRGGVVGLSGGIDSTVTAALAVKAFGPSRVLGLLMPERDSDPDSLRLGHAVADWLGIERVVEDIEPLLTAAGCYRRRDDFIRRIVPEFAAGWGCKLAIANALSGDGYSISYLVVQSPSGETAQAPHAGGRLSRHRRRHQHEAADAEAARIFPRRPAQLCRPRHAQPARIRPGLLRQERRRRGRPEADRASLQEPGLPARRASPRAGGSPRAAALDRHLAARGDAGGVLLLAALPADGPLPPRPRQRPAGGTRWRAPPGSRPSRSRASGATLPQSGAPRSISTQRRSSSSRCSRPDANSGRKP